MERFNPFGYHSRLKGDPLYDEIYKEAQQAGLNNEDAVNVAVRMFFLIEGSTSYLTNCVRCAVLTDRSYEDYSKGYSAGYADAKREAAPGLARRTIDRLRGKR